MAKDFDICTAADQIINASPLLERESMSLENGAMNAGDANVLVRRNISAGAVLKGAGALLVEGSLAGSPRWPCRVEMGGDVVVLGSVENAHLSGRHIWVGKDASHCQLMAVGNVAFGGDVADARILSGDYEAERRLIEEMKIKVSKAREEQEHLEGKVRFEERRMDRVIQATQINLHLELGNIIQNLRKRIAIDLKPFYRIVGPKTAEEIDLSLMEFFSRGVVGMLARTNRDYLVKNPNRQTIFLGVIRSLRDLFSITRQLDRHIQGVVEMESLIPPMLERLKEKRTTVCVRKALRPEVEVRFVCPEVKEIEEGETAIFKQIGMLNVQPNPETAQYKVTRVDVNEGVSALDVDSGELQGVLFHMHEGQVTWERIEVPCEQV